MALAGHSAKISCADSDIAGDEIDGINSVDFGVNADLLDTTDFMDTTGARSRILGLKDVEFTMSGDYESADTGMARLITNFAAGTTTWIRFLPNGTTGFKCACKVENYKLSASVDGKVEVSFSIKATGALGTV